MVDWRRLCADNRTDVLSVWTLCLTLTEKSLTRPVPVATHIFIFIKSPVLFLPSACLSEEGLRRYSAVIHKDSLAALFRLMWWNWVVIKRLAEGRMSEPRWGRPRVIRELRRAPDVGALHTLLHRGRNYCSPLTNRPNPVWNPLYIQRSHITELSGFFLSGGYLHAARCQILFSAGAALTLIPTGTLNKVWNS